MTKPTQHAAGHDYFMRALQAIDFDNDGRTAAHLAASEGQTAVLEYLIAMGVKKDPVDRWNGTPLADAKREGHEEAMRLLGR